MRIGLVKDLKIYNHFNLSFAEYTNKYCLQVHIKMEHVVEVNSLCHICGRGFPTNGRLNLHIMDHGGPHGGNKRKKPKIQTSVNAPVEFDDDYFKM